LPIQGELQPFSQLQALDMRLAELRKEIAELPRQIAVIEKRLEAHIRQLDAAKGVLTANAKERKQKELDIQTFEQKISKLRDQMQQAKTNEQFRAFQNEIDYAQGEIRKAEDRIIGLMEESEPLEKNVRGAETALAAEKKAVEAQKADARQRTAVDQKEVEQRSAERQAVVGTLAPKLAREYERLRKKFPGGVILSEVLEGKCTACQMLLRQQYLMELKASTTIMHCEACGRVLYWNPPMSAVDMS